MKCMDSDLPLYGHYDSNEAANLMLVFEKCDSEKRRCKSEKEIDEWLEFKYFIVHENTKNFVPHLFGEERIEKVAVTKFYPIAAIRTDIV